MSATESDQGPRPLRVAVVGAGYWGPNLARNFAAHPDWDLVAVCDRDAGRARRVAGVRSTVEVLTDAEEAFARPDLDAVAIATPAATHAPLALAALAAGKHVVVEKPIAPTSAQARQMRDAARAASLVLMVDHTFCYTPVVTTMREMIAAGELGELQFVDSVRINLGLVQPDVDVFWDLAPHDLSILDDVLPGGLRALGVSATGADPINAGKACVGHLSMPLEGGAIAHVHVNWLSPTKIRSLVISGTAKTLVWDDLAPQQRLTVYDRGVRIGTSAEDRVRANVSYRVGDAWAPALPDTEALRTMVGEFAAAIREGRAPHTDADAGIRVLELLEAAGTSLAEQGRLVPLARTEERAPAGAGGRTP